MKFAIVVVIYNKKISELPIYPYLSDILNENVPVICYDNSRFDQDSGINNANFIYFHNEKNVGIAEAYNFAWKLAPKMDLDGLLLLDHDTALPFDYIKKLGQEEFKSKVGAISPRVMVGDQQISPLNFESYISAGFIPLMGGEYKKNYTAINSGSLISIAFLEECGGFNLDFPLDFLDYWLFFTMQKYGYYLFVEDYEIQHELSVMEDGLVSHVRYNSILSSETRFYSQFRRDLLRDHKRQLLKRVAKYVIKTRDSFYWRRTLKEYFDVRKLMGNG